MPRGDTEPWTWLALTTDPATPYVHPPKCYSGSDALGRAERELAERLGTHASRLSYTVGERDIPVAPAGSAWAAGVYTPLTYWLRGEPVAFVYVFRPN